MARLLETIAGACIDGGGPLTPVVMCSGDSTTVREISEPGDVSLLRLTRSNVSAGKASVISPNLHDTTAGLTVECAAGVVGQTFPRDIVQPLVPGDRLSIQGQGAGNAISVGLLIEYRNVYKVPCGRYISPDRLRGMVKNIKYVPFGIALPSGLSSWGETPITVSEDLLHQESDYALLGVAADLPIHLIGVKGPDTGNYRIAVPALSTLDEGPDEFVRLSEQLGRPCIPVISGANRYQTFAVMFDSQLIGGSVSASLVFAELTEPIGATYS